MGLSGERLIANLDGFWQGKGSVFVLERDWWLSARKGGLLFVLGALIDGRVSLSSLRNGLTHSHAMSHTHLQHGRPILLPTPEKEEELDDDDDSDSLGSSSSSWCDEEEEQDRDRNRRPPYLVGPLFTTPQRGGGGGGGEKASTASPVAKKEGSASPLIFQAPPSGRQVGVCVCVQDALCLVRFVGRVDGSAHAYIYTHTQYSLLVCTRSDSLLYREKKTQPIQY